MDPRQETALLPGLLGEVRQAALAFREGLEGRPAAATGFPRPDLALPESGVGGAAALDLFRRTFEAGLSGSAGPRYLGYVTGGRRPPAPAGDRLAPAHAQNPSPGGDSGAPPLEVPTPWWPRGPCRGGGAFEGAFVSGATQANLVGLATGRQWAAARVGADAAEEGFAGANLPVLAATPHASVLKALAILGLGRRSLLPVATLRGSEAVDPEGLDAALAALGGRPALVVANAGTVNTGAFDDLGAVREVCDRHGAWMHVDGAFGLFAAAVPDLAPRLRGLEGADSIATDAHKWLNVPYDAGLVFTRHPELQMAVFRASAPYLGAGEDLLHRTPENSRRFRALPAWMALAAYGREGVGMVVARCCRLAAALGRWIESSRDYELLAPVGLNIVAFAPRRGDRDALLAWLLRDGRVFLTPTLLDGRPGIRAAFSSALTLEKDLDLVVAALAQAAQEAP